VSRVGGGTTCKALVLLIVHNMGVRLSAGTKHARPAVRSTFECVLELL
jgi:hypothetical protein